MRKTTFFVNASHDCYHNKHLDQVFVNTEFIKINKKYFVTTPATDLTLMYCNLYLKTASNFLNFYNIFVSLQTPIIWYSNIHETHLSLDCS